MSLKRGAWLLPRPGESSRATAPAGMTLDSVGHEAGLPMGALASHFDNEQELLMAVAADDLAALAKSMRGGMQSAEPSSGGASLELIERVEVLEGAFASMIDRHQKSLHERNDIASWVEQSVKALQQRVETSERPQSRMRSEVKAALPPETQSDPPLPAKVARLLVEPPPIAAVPPSRRGRLRFRRPRQISPIFRRSSLRNPYRTRPTSQEAVLMDNYLLDARRAAIATQAGSENERHEAKRRTKRARVLVGGLPRAARDTRNRRDGAEPQRRHRGAATIASRRAVAARGLTSNFVNVAPGNRYRK